MPLSARSFRTLAGVCNAAALALTLAAPAALTAVAAPAAAQVRGHAAPEAEGFVETQANRALSILADRGMGTSAKKQAFYDFINQLADVPRITDFVLGRYRRALSPAQHQAFSAAFRDYADSVYEARLSDYHGERLTVAGSAARTANDVVVYSQIVGGRFKGQPSQVNWRVLRGGDGRWRVVDVQAQGVWLAVVEQSDFTSTLSNHNGDINVLIAQLRADAARGVAAKAS